MTSKTGLIECYKCRGGHTKIDALGRRRKREGDARGSHTEAEWKAIIRQQGEFCYWCRRSLRDENFVLRATKDHLMPIARGGSNDKENIAASCRFCNQEKSDRTPGEYRVYLAQHSKRFFNISTVPAYTNTKKAATSITESTPNLTPNDLPTPLRKLLDLLADGKRMEPIRAEIDQALAQKRRLYDELERRKLLSRDKTRLVG